MGLILQSAKCQCKLRCLTWVVCIRGMGKQKTLAMQGANARWGVGHLPLEARRSTASVPARSVTSSLEVWGRGTGSDPWTMALATLCPKALPLLGLFP